MRTRLLLALVASATIPALLAAQPPDNDATAKAVSSLGLRTLGPGLMSGRIADIEVHPTDRSTWYVGWIGRPNANFCQGEGVS